ncbi:MAG: hypothetical protein M3Q07_08920, partial [Pseudobdellovibrionaceae bacterium]|nr:hypothetical protein [Pseudobdellovibrionaceae bacterium]
MSVTSLRSRSVGVGAGYSVSLLLALGMGLNACGTQGSLEQTALKQEGTTPQSYQEWCADWQLNCRVPDPGKAPSLSAAQFQALSTILNSALTSPSVFSVTRQELDADSLKQALTALHLEAVYQDIQTRLDASQWQSAGLENGALVSRHAAATSLRTAEGLVWNLEAVQNVTFMPGAIQLSGLGLSADAAKEATVLQSMAVASDETFSLGLNDRSVQQVPLDFALDNLLLAFGLDVTQVSDQEIALPDIIAAGAPLLGWLNQSSRQITLQRSFFATASGQLGVLLPKDNMGQALGNLLSRFETLRTSSDAKNNLGAVSLVKG